VLPSSRSFCLVSGELSALTTSALRRSMIGFGVPAGATSPLHVAASNPA
jgi:hypothetical protein